MKVIFKIILILMASIHFTLVAQDLPVESNYLLSASVINPALTGSNLCFELALTHKRQWIDISNAPMTQTGTLSGRLDRHNGLGITVFNDRNGFTKFMGARIGYAFHIPLSTDIKSPYRTQLSFGVLYSIQTLFVDNLDFNNKIPDPALNQGNYRTSYSNAGAGIFFMHKGFYTGFSAMNILPVKIDIYKNEPEIPRNFYFQLGYLTGQNSSISFRPSILLKMNTIAQRQVDLNLRIKYISKKESKTLMNPVNTQVKKENPASWSLWAESSYQRDIAALPGASMGFIQVVGIELGAYSIAYAYGIPLGEISNFYSGTHHFMLGMSLCPGEAKVQKIESTVDPSKPVKKFNNSTVKNPDIKTSKNQEQVTGILKNTGNNKHKKKSRHIPNKIKKKKMKDPPCYIFDRK